MVNISLTFTPTYDSHRLFPTGVGRLMHWPMAHTYNKTASTEFYIAELLNPQLSNPFDVLRPEPSLSVGDRSE